MRQERRVVGGQPGTVIDGNTFIPDGYQPRERDFDRLRAADRLTRKQASAKYFNSAEDFDRAAVIKGFPLAVVTKDNWHEIQWFSAAAIEKWQDEQRALVATFK
jgi:hypothetical protein